MIFNACVRDFRIDGARVVFYISEVNMFLTCIGRRMSQKDLDQDLIKCKIQWSPSQDPEGTQQELTLGETQCYLRSVKQPRRG